MNNAYEIQETANQNAYIEKINERLTEFEKRTGKRQKYFIFTTGCQMNGHDSEKIAGMLEKMGFAAAEKEKDADFVIYNTCCIRENAEEKIYGRLGRLKYYKSQNPNLKIAICGCMTQQDIVLEKLKKDYKFVDIVFGTFNLYKLPELMYNNIETGESVFDIWQESKGIVENLPILQRSKFQASVNIMLGCNNFCTYCIVPYVRGRERSRNAEDILDEVKRLAQNGVKEVMLLGQNVNSYGKNLNPSVSFATLLRKINEVEGIERIKFMTSHPKDLSSELIDAMADCEKVCDYIHLPVQSGSSRILKLMNRHYTSESYLKLIDAIREKIPNIAISTDIIVGFPGETEEDFNQTIEMVKKAGYSSAFTFLYSKRVGTPAATMPNQAPDDVAKDRFDRLLDVLNPLINEINEKQVGDIVNVLVEEKSKNSDKILTGRAFNNSLVHFAGDEALIGKTVKVKITQNKTFYLLGERVE